MRGKFQTFIFLEGEQSFWLDEKFFHIDAGHGAARRPKALTFTLGRDTDIRLLKGTDTPLNKVSITSPLEWMDQMEITTSERSSEVVDFMNGHLNHLVWEPGPDVIGIAEQISLPPRWLTEDLLPLYRSARGLDIMVSVCRRLTTEVFTDPHPVPLSTRAHMERVREFLLDRLHQDLQIGEIARETGTSIRSLQRKFRDCFGETVFEFVRNARLERAREALMRDQVSISEAATVAGYTSPAAFSTAFKNRFGEIPRRLKSFHAPGVHAE
ncbi:helix-turn-helix domain-containing protein [Roseibium aggregatum]|uniref:Helix-turn-helix transcriptional regulator n=1 Tax=Roseibium aggregatum TaxID=187304 RepID=A0A939EFJ1_9HYPH|nr:AraC family transcriptional regulator [Roseibium aggregatum]MBN9672302.1 helix-turn-helix transcriptional regulator [Roseibium aggregatum]